MSELEIDLKDAGGAKICGILNIDGLVVNHFNRPAEEAAKIVRNIKELKIRDDDVMLCTPPKSGTHWTFEILNMLLANKAEISDTHKIFLMLSATPEGKLDSFPSPRVLNTHVPFHMLPRQVQEKKIKIITVLRNPKDVAVSFYYHYKGLQLHKYDGKFSDYLPLFMEGKLEFNDWFEYVLEAEKAAAAEPDRIRIFYFEDLIENGLEVIQNLAEFLQLPAANDLDLCKVIHDKCSFKSIKTRKQYKPEEKTMFKDDFHIMRKGVIGDWRNHFTVAENEAFDILFADKMNHSKLKFRFVPAVEC